MIILEEKQKINNSKDVSNLFKKVLDMRNIEDNHKECFYVMGLNTQNIVLYIDLVTMGTINSCNPVIRECLKLALMKNATSIILCHNHPSGMSKPSVEDTAFTKKIKEASAILNISCLDHIILGDDYFSYADKGLLF